MRAAALALAILLAAPGCSAEADAPAGRDDRPVQVAIAIPERPDGPVLDEADVLSPQAEAALDARLRDYWERSRIAVVVATVNSLGNARVEDYALQVARSWDIGDRETGRGLLVLVAPNDRRLRIEVGCGLESVITDEFAKQVIDQTMTPSYRASALEEGTLAGVDALIERLDRSVNPAPVSDECRSQLKRAA